MREGYGTWSVCVCVCVSVCVSVCLSVCLSVCPAPRVLLRVTECPTEGYGFGAIWLNMSFSLKLLCSKVMACKSQQANKYATSNFKNFKDRAFSGSFKV